VLSSQALGWYVLWPRIRMGLLAVEVLRLSPRKQALEAAKLLTYSHLKPIVSRALRTCSGRAACPARGRCAV